MDDFTRFTWIHILKFKSETQDIIKSFFSWVQTQFNLPIKTFRSDNRSEFLSLQSFFHHKGTSFQHSCPYTPQQNGIVERKHRHLLNVGRALRFQAHIPLRFLGESIQTACYLINHLPTPLLHHKTPYEILHHTSLIILTYGFLVVCVTQPIFFLNTSLMFGPVDVCFLVTPLVKKVIAYMILIHNKFFPLEMWFFMNIYSLFLYPLLIIQMTHLPYPTHLMTPSFYPNPTHLQTPHLPLPHTIPLFL